MRATNSKLDRLPLRKFTGILTGACFALLLTAPSSAQELQPKRFPSAAEASSALFRAVQNEDEKAVEAILGVGKDVTSTADEVEDKLEREHFSRKYMEMHRLVREPDGSTVLYIGAENWPFPFPLVSEGGAWHFDPNSGAQEILFRRVGENETTAIKVCHGVGAAGKQQDSATSGNDPIVRYARALVADRTGNGDSASRATAPFHGYYFRFASGKRADGVELIAYPAVYGASGVMTFIVTQKGAVYEKNLGPNTTKVALNVKNGPPGSGWHNVSN